MWVKICGVTQTEVARTLCSAELLPDAIGLNFYKQSKRCVSRTAAADIVELLPTSVTPVGLFVNHTLQEIREICDQCRLTTIQLHGDETPEFAADLAEYQLIKAFRVGEAGLDAVADELERYRQLGIKLSRCLIDSQVTGSYGGTGHRAPWDLLRTDWQKDWPALTLAGGLTPENVAEAIATVQPAGVDVASGVEERPGVQSLDKVTRFLTSAKASIPSRGS